MSLPLRQQHNRTKSPTYSRKNSLRRRIRIPPPRQHKDPLNHASVSSLLLQQLNPMEPITRASHFYGCANSSERSWRERSVSRKTRQTRMLYPLSSKYVAPGVESNFTTGTALGTCDVPLGLVVPGRWRWKSCVGSGCCAGATYLLLTTLPSPTTTH